MAIYVEREGIESCISKIQQAIEDLQTAASQIDSTMGELPTYWQGAAYDKAQSQLSLIHIYVFCSDNIYLNLGDARKLITKVLDHGDELYVKYQNSDYDVFSLSFMLDLSLIHIFSDFEEKYGIHDMYSGGFYPYDTLEEYWAWWSRQVYYNRYVDHLDLYQKLFQLVKDKDYFVLTTNVDHCFQKAGFDKQRLFYTQGDYGLFQCSSPCHQETYDNEKLIKKMVEQQKDCLLYTSIDKSYHIITQR